MSSFLRSLFGAKKAPKVIKTKMQTRRLELIGLEERITPTIVFDMLAIGNAGNAPDHQGGQGDYGSVGYNYAIARTETTVAEYVQFLNAVAHYVPAGSQYEYLSSLWNDDMEAVPPSHSVIGGQVTRNGTPGNWTYTVATGAEQLPIANVSWFNAARFVNWLSNGQPVYTSFVADPGTEMGAYTLDGNRETVITTRMADARYWLPSEDEWYKAAYYDPTKVDPLTGIVGGYWKFATRLNIQPYNGDPRLLSDPNAANYNAIVTQQGDKLKPVGSFVNSVSYYGTLDQAGSLWEWSDTYIDNYLNQPNSMIVRGGSWSLGILTPNSSIRRDYTPNETDDDTGFRIAGAMSTVTLIAAPTQTPAANPEVTPTPSTPANLPSPVPNTGVPGAYAPSMVRIGNPGNRADSTTGYGAVANEFSIGKYETTVGEYVNFLNTVATSASAPDYIRALWQSEMNDSTQKTGALIIRTLNQNNAYSYQVAPGPANPGGTPGDRAHLPVAFVNWFACARYANWLSNGSTAEASTETGAYNLNGAVTGVFKVQPGARYWLPSEDQWYKAAYYDPAKNGVGGYWKYATQSDTLPSYDFLGTNSANYNDERSRGYKLSLVGAYVNSNSYYGTFDMTGNLWEWDDGVVLSPTTTDPRPGQPPQQEPDSRIIRGGSWSQGLIAVANYTRRDYPTGYQLYDEHQQPVYLFYTDDDTGFRLAGLAELTPTSVTPTLVTGTSPTTGTGGSSTVSLTDPNTGAVIGSAVPFPGFTGQLRVASADLNNDGINEIVAAAGPGGGPAIAIINSQTGQIMQSFFAFDPAFTGGVFVTLQDANNDGIVDIIAGAGQGGGPEVRIFNGANLQVIKAFFAYDQAFTGGVSVATTDLNNDGILDLVTGAGRGGAPHVKVFDGATGSIISQWFAYPVDFTGGVFVAVGDIGNNGTFEVVTGAGAGGAPQVGVWNPNTGENLAQFLAYAPDFTGGVTVGVSDGNADGVLDLITGAGPSGGPEVKGFSFPQLDLLFSFFSGDPTNTAGVFVS